MADEDGDTDNEVQVEEEGCRYEASKRVVRKLGRPAVGPARLVARRSARECR